MSTCFFGAARSGLATIRIAAIAAACFMALSASAGLVPQRQAGASSAAAATSGVFPPMAQPFGHSLTDMARHTAAFNVTDHSGMPPAPVDGSTKLRMLYITPANAFTVPRNTVLYVPVVVADNSQPVIGDFPNVADRSQVLNYLFSATQLGMQFASITVDGKEYPLDERYVAAVQPGLLPNGATQYIVVAAYLKPLPAGTHTVRIHSKLNGAALQPYCPYICDPEGNFVADQTYQVTVQ